MRNTPLLGIAVTAALLAGCSGAGSPIPGANMALTPTRQGAITSLREIRARYAHVAIEAQEPFVDVAAVNAPHGNQTIVSGYNGVSVWGANGRLNAFLTTGVTNAEGIATDAAENLYVVNAITNNVLVYPKPYNKLGFALNDFGEDPNGVAVSNAGVVAVTSLYNESTRGPGSVSFYAKGATAPCATIADPNWREMGFDAFDGSGNLYVNGINTAGSKVLVGRISGALGEVDQNAAHGLHTPIARQHGSRQRQARNVRSRGRYAVCVRARLRLTRFGYF